MCHIHVETPIVINRFSYFLKPSRLFGSEQSGSLVFYLVARIARFFLTEKRTVSKKIGRPIDYNGNYNVGMTRYLNKEWKKGFLIIVWQ